MFAPLLVTTFAALLAPPPAAAAPTAHPQRFAIVELFTSEGCSSCPPADELLRRIANTAPVAGLTVLALSEHVTYWNQLGWRDPFSAETFTDRQNAYASRFNTDGPYTPQMVVNGRVQFVGSNSAALHHALETEAGTPGTATLQIGALTRDAGHLHIEYKLLGVRATDVEIVAAITDDADETRVLRGENGGSTLRHAAVVRSFSKLDGSGAAYLAIPAWNPSSGHHIVLFAQRAHLGDIIAADARSL